MPGVLTRINNNQVTDAVAGNIYLGVNAAAKVQEYSVTSGLLANNLVYGSDLTVTGNLTINGNTTTVDTYNLVVEDPLILLAKGQTGSPTLDIGFIGKRGTDTNIAFVWDEGNDRFVTAYTSSETTNTTITITSVADLQTGNLTVSGNTSFTGNIASLTVTGSITGGNLLTSGVVSATGNVTGGNVTTAGVVTASGNVTGGNITTGGAITATGAITTNNGVTASGNVTGGNVTTGGLITATGNVTGGNITTGGAITATGAITTNTGVTAVGNVTGGNLTTGGLITATGNIQGGNLLTTGLVSATGNGTFGNVSGTNVTGTTISASGNVIGGNVTTTGLVTASGNVTGGNITTGGAITATGAITTNNGVTAVGNVTGGNITTAGQITAQGNITGNYYFGNGFYLDGVANATTASKLVNGTSNVDIPTANGNVTVGVNGTGNVLVIANSGIYVTGVTSASGNVTGGNITTGGAITATGAITTNNGVTAVGNVTGGNVTTGGLITATGNVTGGNITTGGAITATGAITTNNGVTAVGNVTGGNLTTGGLVTATGNVIGGNITTTGLMTAGGNVTGANFLTTGLVSAQGNITGGNLNSTSVNNPNGGLSIYAAGDVSFTQSGNIDATSSYINNLLDPQQNQDAATKYYVDTMVSTGLAYHTAVFAATTTTLATTTGGTITYTQPNGAGNGVGAVISTTGSFNLIDTANVQTLNTRILVKNEANAVLNGVYYWANATAIIRTTDADEYGPNSPEQLSLNDYFFVQDGNVNKGSAWVVDGPSGTITFGTSNITFAQFSSSQTYTANSQAGISLTGTVFSALVDNNTTAFDGSGNIVVKAGANLTTPNIGAATGTSLSVTGNVTGGNVNTGGLISATGNVYASYFVGNIQGNLTSPGANTQVIFNDNNVANATAGMTFDKTANLFTVSGNISGGNLLTNGFMSATGNAYANNFIGSTVSTTGNIQGGNILTGGLISATSTITSAANITGGNLLTGGLISATGTATAGNVSTAGFVTATGNVQGGNLLTAGLISAGGNITGANVNSGNLSLTGNVLSNLNVTGNVAGGNLLTTGLISSTGNVTGGNILTGGLISATSTITSAANITGGNLLTGGLISSTGNVQAGNVNTGIVSATGNINGANVNVGTGNVTGGNVSVTGNVYAANFIGNISGNIDAAGSNTWVQFNDTGDILGASANFTFDKGTNTLTVSGTIGGTTISASGNVVGGNVTTAGLVSATANVIGGNLTTTGLITATGNVQAGNINTAGLVSATGNVQGGNILGTKAVFGTSFTAQACSTVTINATDSILMPVGNTTQRPNSTAIGMLRFNTSGDALEVYTSTGWTDVGVPAFTVITDQQFQGTGACTTFTLSADSTTAATIVSINGIVQIPTTAYAVTGNSLQFTEAPAITDTIDVRSLTTTTTVTSIENTSANAIVEVLSTADTVQITGNLLPVANITYDLGSPTKMWKNGYFAGNTIYLGNLQLKQADSNTFAVYTADGMTQANIDVGSVDVSSINSGTTAIGIGAPNGNAYMAPAGSNALVAATTGVYVTGVMSASGNITGNYLFGNGSTLSGIITSVANINNGTSNMTVVSSGGNIAATIGGTSNVQVLATTGVYITGVMSASGNVTGGNLLTSGYISATGIISSAGNITGANYLTGGLISATGNVTSGNVNTGIISASGNVTGANYLTGGLISATGNVTGGNLSVGTGTVNLGNIVNTNSNGVGNIGSATTYFNTVFAKATSAQYADLAEMYEADSIIEPGTVVCFGGAKEITACTEDNCKRVAGVVSTNPSYIMNAGLAGDCVTAVALTGRVPTKVTGSIRKGDMLVAAGSGRARAEADPAVGTVIGKALADFDGAEGVIEVVVGRL